MPLYDTEYTHALIMAMVCSLAAFLLCWLWNLASATYAYDGIGNLATSIWNTAATTYSANALNQYMSIFSTGGFSWPEYSVNGELTSHDGHWLAYDAKSRLVSVHAWVYDEEGYARWNQFAIQSRKESNASNRYKVKALHLFTHSGLGQLYLHKEALSAQHLQKLKRLNWADGAELVCHGCSSGVENKFGNSVAGSFYKSQKISTLGQAAASSFSSEPNTKSKWGVVFGTSTDVYLWAFDSDGNAIEAIKYPKTDKETR